MARAKKFSLYWCSTNEGDEDWFVVAASDAAAQRVFAALEGFEDEDVFVEEVAPLPEAYVRMREWRSALGGPWRRGAGYPSDELLRACGGGAVSVESTDEAETKTVWIGAREFVSRKALVKGPGQE